jgi:transposase, IS5 family
MYEFRPERLVCQPGQCRYAHAKQFKRHHRQLRLLRSRLGRIIRREITGRPELEAVFEAPMARAAQIRSQQQRQRG